MAIKYSNNKSGSKRVTKTTSIDDKGNISNRVTASSNIGTNSSTSFTLDVGGVVGPLFKFSLAVVIGSYIFTGAWDNKLKNNTHNVPIVNETKVIEYDSNNQAMIVDKSFTYNVKFVNYNWLNKINQLNGLKNVFDIDLFTDYDGIEFDKIYYTFNHEDYTELDYENYKNYRTGPIYDYLYSSYSINPTIKYLLDNDYIEIFSLEYDSTLFGKPLKSFSFLYFNKSYYDDKLFYTYDSNLSVYLNYNDNINDFALALKDKKFGADDIVNIIVAPATITRNIFYDIGVILSFIVSW